MPYELTNYCEIDKYASKAYSLIHKVSQEKNLGDISKVDEKDLADFDLLTYGFPCQSLSVAGKKEGIIKGQTRSGLLYEALRIIKHKKPKYAICENVKNLVGKRFKEDFEKLLAELESYGYRNYWKILNAKNYGIPQNRERVFIVSIRKDVGMNFEFPRSMPLKLCLSDMLEDKVDKKFYLSKTLPDGLIENIKRKQISNTIRTGGRGSTDRHLWDLVCAGNVNPSGKGMNGNVFLSNGLCPTLTTNKGEGIKIVESKIKQVCNISATDDFSNPQRGRVDSSSGISPCLTTCQGGGLEPKVVFNERIRKLTPKECLRLMGFTDSDYQTIAAANISNTQIYKMAGNSIVVPVIEGILTNLLKGELS